MTLEEVKHYLEGVNGKQIKLGLGPMKALMEALEWPDKTLKIIHVAGTNGKGSVCEMMSQILQCAGYKVGTYNTPYFEEPNECIRINNEMISDTQLLNYMNQIEPILNRLNQKEMMPSGFEILTALAFLYFSNEKVDYVILEVGLGGRLDATNIIEHSELSVITKIAMDHQNFLGNSLGAIASEKAGIIKTNGWVVTPVQEERVMDVISKQCKKMSASLNKMLPNEIEYIKVTDDKVDFFYQGEQYSLSMSGKYQAYNASLAIKAIETLKEYRGLHIEPHQIKEGLKQTKWAGRFEKVKASPLFFIDGAHNVDGIRGLAETLEALPKKKTIAIVGILRDKEVDEMLKIIAPLIDTFIVTKPLNPRAMEVEELAQKIKPYTNQVYIKEEIREALDLALTLASEQIDQQILGFGSLYMLGRLRKLILA